MKVPSPFSSPDKGRCPKGGGVENREGKGEDFTPNIPP